MSLSQVPHTARLIAVEYWSTNPFTATTHRVEKAASNQFHGPSRWSWLPNKIKSSVNTSGAVMCPLHANMCTT